MTWLDKSNCVGIWSANMFRRMGTREEGSLDKKQTTTQQISKNRDGVHGSALVMFCEYDWLLNRD